MSPPIVHIVSIPKGQDIVMIASYKQETGGTCSPLTLPVPYKTYSYISNHYVETSLTGKF